MFALALHDLQEAEALPSRSVFEAFLDSSAGPYVLGNQISLAEIMLVPFLDRFRYLLKHYRGYDLLKPGSKIEAMFCEFEKRSSFQASAEPASYYIPRYEGYVGARGASSFSE